MPKDASKHGSVMSEDYNSDEERGVAQGRYSDNPQKKEDSGSSDEVMVNLSQPSRISKREWDFKLKQLELEQKLLELEDRHWQRI